MKEKMDWRKKHEQTGFAWRKIPFGTGGRDDSAIYWSFAVSAAAPYGKPSRFLLLKDWLRWCGEAVLILQNRRRQ